MEHQGVASQSFLIQKEAVLEYFKNEKEWNRVYDLINENQLSRRLLDYLVTEYSRKHIVQYPILLPNGSTQIFNIYHSAQTILKGLHKKGIDPFRRYNCEAPDGGLFEWGPPGKRVVTSVCQLTFFRWALRNGVIDYALEHKREIENEMSRSSRQKRQERVRRTGLPYRRMRSTKNQVNLIFNENVETVQKFK